MTLACKICDCTESTVCANVDQFLLRRCSNCSAIYRVDKMKAGDFGIEEADINLENVWQEYEKLY